MVQFMNYEEDFYEFMRNTDRKLVIYGIGHAAQKVYPFLENISYACDKKADGKLLFHDLVVLKPEELQNLTEKIVILICIKRDSVRQQVRETLSHYTLDANVFEFYDNIAFNCFRKTEYMRCKVKINYVRLVCSDNGWILSKFANRMKEQLELRGIKAEIGNCIDLNADINHHIAFHEYEPIGDAHDTLMITHIDSLNKVNLLKHQLKTARMGICMSRETMDYLNVCGVPRSKLCYINPAQDGGIKVKKYILGITHRNHEDGRKRNSVLIDICKELDPMYFHFKIMGDGWEKIVEQLNDMGFEVDYYPEFVYDTYTQLIPSLDYYLFWGFDEGSMGYLDALAAGVDTIVTPQGYHLDIRDGITYPCRIVKDFVNVLLELQNARKKRAQSVSDWTWSNYVDKHLMVWKYLLGSEEGIYKDKHKYEDGIFSVLRINV